MVLRLAAALLIVLGSAWLGVLALGTFGLLAGLVALLSMVPLATLGRHSSLK